VNGESKLILPALTEATSPLWRPIKYSLFPPLGLATLAAYLDPDDEAEIQDEHVEPLEFGDTPDLVVIQVYITSAYRAYRIADHYRNRDAYVVMGGLRHFAYAAGWKKFEPLWDVVIRAKRAGMMLPVLETILSEFGRRSAHLRLRYALLDAASRTHNDLQARDSRSVQFATLPPRWPTFGGRL
jgi:hypothetical protein